MMRGYGVQEWGLLILRVLTNGCTEKHLSQDLKKGIMWTDGG